MAHFFFPSQSDAKHGEMAAENAALSELVVLPGGFGRFAVWGGGPDNKPLTVKVQRSGAVVSEGAHPAVKLQRASNDPATHIQVYSASGLQTGDQIQGWDGAGLPQTAPMPVRVLTEAAGDVMDHWALRRASGDGVPDARACCHLAIPYISIPDPMPKRGGRMSKLKADHIGGPMANIHGLSIHSTAGSSGRSAFEMACFGCVNTWNAQGPVSAHFGVSGDGTIIQFVPTTFQAFAQGTPGDYHWLSVEIDNDGKAGMTAAQLMAVRSLFRWVTTTFGVPPRVATGWLPADNKAFDKITKEVAAAAGASSMTDDDAAAVAQGHPTLSWVPGRSPTTDNYEAAMSQGLSCHWWLDPRKTGAHVHACPGPGILSQFPTIVS